jgi:hypothetical protein
VREYFICYALYPEEEEEVFISKVSTDLKVPVGDTATETLHVDSVA